MAHDNEGGGAHTTAPSRASGKWLRGTVRIFGPTLLVGFAAPFIFPGLRRAAKPVAKGIIKGALILGESAKEAATTAKEQLSDLMAEVNAEREQEAREATDKRDSV